MRWIDVVLPYRFWLKLKDADSIKNIEQDFLPKSYDPSLVLPEYRKKIKQLNDQADNSADDSKKIRDLKDSLDSVNNSFLKDKGPYIAGAEAALFLGQDAYNAYQSVDEYVYEGMSRLSGENLDNIADLSTKVQSYEHDFWGGLTDSGISKVGGHIGEAYAADSLQSKGLDVQWAEESNQAGWDLLVNGHEMNVKIVADANSLSQHFNEYPDIPVIIPGDATNIPEDAINIGSEAGIEELNQALSDGTENIIAVDPTLSGQDIMSHTEEATDFATGAVDAVDSFIPFITVGISGSREFKLLREGHTTIVDSAKNFGLDIAGTAVGSTIGAKTGAVIGSLIFPGVGTAIGGVIGGVAGAFFGRGKTDEVKKQALTEAFDNYKNEAQRFERDKQVILTNTNESINKLKKEVINDINKEKNLSKIEIDKRSKEIQSFRKHLHNVNHHEYESFKKNSLIEIEELFFKVKSQKNARNKWKALFFPSIEDFAITKIIESLEKLKHKINSINTYASSLDRSKIINIFSEVGLQQNAILDLLMDRELSRYKYESTYQSKIDSLISSLAKKRHQGITRISSFITQATQNAHKSIKGKVEIVLDKMEVVNIEKRKLGIK